MRWIARIIYYKLLGWKIVGNTNFSSDAIKKAIIIAAPHTSWQDFHISLLLRKIIGIKISFIGKKELFVGPLGWYLRAIGGAPVDRTSGQNKVEAIAKLFDDKEEFRLALAPEGTRKKVDKWRTGFYYMAKTAKVPIIMVTLDFKNKQNKISEPFFPTDNMEEDFKFMYKFFEGVIGKVPQYS